ncbi:MAG: aldehyde dehydrogenase family protein, partial [Flavisolibacter sp.]
YLLVHASIKEKFVKELTDNITRFYTEDPSTSYNYGKIVNEKQFNRLMNYLQQGKIIFGGQHDALTYFIGPTLLDNITPELHVMDEEIFGPVLPILTFDNFEEAKNIILKNPEPLAFYVFTQSKQTEKKWLTEIPFGGGCVNNASWHLTNYNLPFGGRGNSGIGGYHGKFSFDVFSHKKSIMRSATWFDPDIKYPPFKGKLGLFRKIIR